MSHFSTDDLQRNGKERALQTDHLDFEKLQPKDGTALPRTLGAGVSILLQSL